MQDHRKLARWQINRQAKFKVDQSPGELLCQVQDINYKGAGVISEAKSQWSNSYIQQRGNTLPQLLCLVAVIGIIVSIIYWIFPWIVFVGGFVIVTISVVGLRVFHFVAERETPPSIKIG